MKVCHATPARNLRSIMRHGLLKERSKGRMKAIWLHAANRSPWAVLHVARRHDVAAEDVVIITLDVPRRWLRSIRQRGLWFCRSDIPSERFREVITFARLAAVPA